MLSPTRMFFACAHSYLTALGVLFGFFVPVVQRAECQASSRQQARTVEIAVSPHPTKRVPTYGGSFQPGQGYDSIAGDTKNAAVVNSGLTPPEKGMGRATFTLQSAYSVAELASKLGVSASASFEGTGGGANVAMNYAKQIATRQESIYVVVSVEVENTARGLTLPYKPAVDTRSSTSDTFFANYGDYFVSGIIYGGSYRGVLEIHNDSLAEKEDLKVHVDGHMGPVSASADLQREISSFTQNKRVTAFVIRVGGVGNIDPEKLLEEAKSFPSTVGPDTNPVPVAVELQPYSTVNFSKRVAIDTDVAYANLHYLAEQTKKLNDLQDYLEFAKENSELFEKFDQDKLEPEMERAAETINQINISAANLMKHPATATSHVIDYRSSFSEPKLKNPPEFPVTIESYSWALDSGTWAKTPSIAQGQAGTSGRWIQGFNLKFATRTYGLSIHYKGYFACGHLTNQNSLLFDLLDGDLAGGPNMGTLCALRSLTIDLKGPRAGDYAVSYGGVIWQFIDPAAQARGGTAVTRPKKRGQTLQVDSDQPEFNSVSPATWIQQIEVHVTKREPKKAEAE